MRYTDVGNKLGASTVQDAIEALIDFLYKSGGGAGEALQVTGVFRVDPQDGNRLSLPLKADELLTPEFLTYGLRFEFNKAVARAAVVAPGVDGRPVGAVIVDLPWPVTTEEISLWWNSERRPPSEAVFAFSADKTRRRIQP